MTYQPPQQQPVAYEMPVEYGTPPPRRRNRTRWIVAGVLALAAVGTGAGLLLNNAGGPEDAPVVGSDDRPVFTEALTNCAADRAAQVADEGRTLVIEALDGGLTSSQLSCVLDHLGTTTAVREHLNSTRALDGQQTDSWPGYTARWTYHPDDGLQMTIQKA